MDDNNYYKIIAEHLIYIRLKYNETCENIAHVLGVTKQAYSLYEKGKRQISVSSLAKLALHYNVSLDYFLSLKDMRANKTSVYFETYKKINDRIKPSDPLHLPNPEDEVIMVEEEKSNKTHVFLKTNTYTPNEVMLFEDDGELKMAEIFFNKDSAQGFYKYGEECHFLRYPKDTSKIIYLGVKIGTFIS